MPRTLSATTTTEIAKTVTSPFYLVYIGFGTPVYYSSGSRAILSEYYKDESGDFYTDVAGNKYNDEGTTTWTPNDIQVSISPDSQTGSIKIQNTDFIIGGLVSAANGIGNTAIKIYQAHGSGQFEETDPELLFDGVGDTCAGSDRWITIGLKVSGTDQQHPFIRCTKEIGFNHLPPNGLTITWEGNKLTLGGEA